MKRYPFNHFSLDVAAAMEQLLHEKTNHLCVFLRTFLSQEHLDYRELIAFGLGALPANPLEQPNGNLADYFWILSEVKDLPEEAVSFCLDAKLFAEGDELVDLGRQDLMAAYKEMVRPSLPH